MSRPESGGLRAGDVLARRYLLMEPIGRGGMSVIWRTFDQSLQRMVAVKILDGDFGADRELIRREARATARLIHPDAIEVYDYGETVTAQGRLAAYVVMRLLEGRPLSDRLAEGPLPWAEAVTVAGKLATVLAAAHERGIVHRDVTAENVMLTADGAKLLDFGIAAFIGEEGDDRASEYGTPPYVAPERLTGTAADPAGDVYALGVLLFEMLTGGTPYPERTWEEIEQARRDRPPPEPHVPGLPPEVAALCRRCLSHEPRLRPDARQVAAVLTAAPTAGRSSPPRRAAAVTVAAVAVLTAGALTWAQLTGVFDPPAGTGLAVGTPSVPVPVTAEPSASAPVTAEPSPSGARSPGPRTDADPTGPATPVREPDDEPDDEPVNEIADSPAEETATPMLMVEATRPSSPALGPSVRRFNALLAQGENTGAIRPDVALDLRQVLSSSICCGQDLSRVRGKIADRHREGAITDVFREALNDQLVVVALAMAR
ncbi:serine/threonine-protein kinase [Planobispora takensis]|uniref:non-specific serine/threonine protein kinase n=1 Tax=Planobispora takensis TaxID=1367882 RepID=A0A8J3SZC6_9ACTN|nr:serine/threonine-protein kinase [Planobispora takensis]GII02953.1 putative serine/threonine protein kinase [Planobispora takensis]